MKKLFASLLIFSILCGIGIYITDQQTRSILKQATDTVNMRAGLFNQYFTMLSTQNRVSRNSIARYYTEAQNDLINTPVINHIQHQTRDNFYYLSPVNQPDLSTDLSGTITILGSADITAQPLLDELTAIIHANEQLSAYNRSNGLAIWSYYTSARGFMYLMPAHAIKDFHFIDPLYEKPFWAQAVPPENADYQQVITDLYDDAAGQGLMITLSDPVTVDNKLLGVVSLDIGIDYMQSVLKTGSTVGTTILIDEKKLLVAG